MSFTLPQFNCRGNIWRSTDGGITYNKIATDVHCQVYMNARMFGIDQGGVTDDAEIFMQIRVPWATDLREEDFFEVTAPEPWFGVIDDVMPVHMGFPNQYRTGFTELFAGTISFGALLMETGEFILLEDGSKILLE